jgi:hypothetical protein
MAAKRSCCALSSSEREASFPGERGASAPWWCRCRTDPFWAAARMRSGERGFLGRWAESRRTRRGATDGWASALLTGDASHSRRRVRERDSPRRPKSRPIAPQRALRIIYPLLGRIASKFPTATHRLASLVHWSARELGAAEDLSPPVLIPSPGSGGDKN